MTGSTAAMRTVTWREFATARAELAAYVADRLERAPSYLATLRPDGWPRVHPVGPLWPRDGSLVVPMYPTSPKGHDLRRDGWFALHGGVEDNTGGGGEVLVAGVAVEADPSEEDRAKGYVLFALLVGEVRAVRYGAGGAPLRSRWTA